MGTAVGSVGLTTGLFVGFVVFVSEIGSVSLICADVVVGTAIGSVTVVMGSVVGTVI